MRAACCVFAICGIASAATAALVEVRIVERTGQVVADAADPQLDFAVQVRVNSSTRALSNPVFGLRLFGEAQSRGQFSFGRISRLDDRMYTSEVGGPGPGFESGLAAQYRYNVDINSAFNGLINANGGPWTQGPDQDIGLVFGRSLGARLVQTPGLDADGDEVPDTAAPGATTAVVPGEILSAYFAQQNWIDVYRFRYRVIDLSPRVLDLRVLDDPSIFAMAVFNGEIVLGNGVWGQFVESVPRSEIAVTNWTGTVIPAPSVGGMILMCAVVGARRRR